MIKIEYLHPLLVGVAKNKEGISSYYLSQEVCFPDYDKDHDKVVLRKFPEQRVRYYLQECEKLGFIERADEWKCKGCGKKYKSGDVPCKYCGGELIKKRSALFVLTNEVFIQNGFGIIYDKQQGQFSFIGCPYFGNCPCTGIITDDCNLLKDLKTMPIVKRFLRDRKKKVEVEE